VRAETCIHYQGARAEKICERGIDVRARFQPCWPCWTGNSLPKSSAVCPFFQAPTAEQIAEHKAKSDAAVKRMLAGNAALWEWEEKQPAKTYPMRGTITCPTCSLPMDVCITEHQVYARCETEKCTNFRGTRSAQPQEPK
jgi:hypothetical protein